MTTATPSKCPFIAANSRPADDTTTNRAWWPNQLDITVLQRNSPMADPMGPAFDYAKEFKSLDLHALCADLRALMTDSQPWWPADWGHYGGLFIGGNAAEVLGDYGAGPNHTLPTGGTARSTGGLCVMTFLRVRTWMRVDDPVAAQQMTADAVQLGELEGLHGHAAAARARLPGAALVRASELVAVPSGISTRGNSDERLLIAIPKKGRMHEKCLKFLNRNAYIEVGE